MVDYVEISVFDVDDFENLLKTTYEKNKKIVFIVYFSKVPLKKVLNLIPILEKYRLQTREKLEKTIIHVETECEKWIATRLLSLIKPEKPVEIIVSNQSPL